MKTRPRASIIPSFLILSILVLAFLAPAPCLGQNAELERAKKLDRKSTELSNAGNYKAAVRYAQEALAIREKALGPEHPDTARSLNSLGLLYYYLGAYDKAEPLYKRALAIDEKALGPEHPDTAIDLNNLAALYRDMGAYDKAEPLFKRALAIYEKSRGPEHPTTVTILNNLASLYISIGAYDKAESLSKRALAINEKTLGPEHQDTAISLSSLASLYLSMAAYDKAEPLLKRALAIYEKAYGPEHPYTAACLSNLASLYLSMSAYDKAEPLLKRALAIYEKTLGPEHPSTAACLSNLAALYLSMGAIDRAEFLLKRALVIYEKTLGPEHPSTATILNGLALLYNVNGAHDKAELLNKRALAIKEKALGAEHPEKAASLNHLARLYISMEDYAMAEPLLIRALAIYEKTLGPEHPDTTTSLSMLAEIYRLMGAYEKAEPLLKRALAIYEKSLGPEHPSTANGLYDLAKLMAAMGKNQAALDLFKRNTSTTDRIIQNIMGFASEEMKLAFLSTISGETDIFLSLITSHLPDDIEATTAGLNLLLSRKGITLEAQSRFQQALFSGDPKVADTFDELSKTKARLIKLAFGNPDKEEPEAYNKKITALEKKREELEGKLSRVSARFALEKRTGKATAESVAAAMPEDTVLIEFARPMIFNFQGKGQQRGTTAKDLKTLFGLIRWDSARYIAFLLPGKRPDQIKLIDLGEAEEIDDLITRYRNAIKTRPRHARALKISGKKGQDDLSQLASALYEKIFAPIAPYLNYRRYLFISPEGKLSLLPFETLMDEKGRYLIESYTFNYLAAGRDILRFGFGTTSKNPALIIADPDFDLSGKQFAKGGDDKLRSRDLSGFTFDPLPETRIEARAIEGLLKDRKSSPQTFLGEKALEKALRNNPRPRILHLATHGFFLTDNDYGEPEDTRAISIEESQPNPKLAKLENPMLRSGIALAGANRGLREGSDLGLICAEKITTLNLQGTDIVALSACDTGIGEIKNSEGVFGLRRAFILAGARTLVMSMWPVPDKETRELMTAFYSSYLQGTPKIEALRKAALAQMKKTPHPYYWGAFIGLGEPD